MKIVGQMLKTVNEGGAGATKIHNVQGISQLCVIERVSFTIG
jgi:hypothetical protein